MQIEHILIAGFSILIAVVGFFLTKFVNQVERVVNDVGDIKTAQATTTARVDGIEKQLDMLKPFILPKMQQQ